MNGVAWFLAPCAVNGLPSFDSVKTGSLQVLKGVFLRRPRRCKLICIFFPDAFRILHLGVR